MMTSGPVWSLLKAYSIIQNEPIRWNTDFEWELTDGLWACWTHAWPLLTYNLFSFFCHLWNIFIKTILKTHSDFQSIKFCVWPEIRYQIHLKQCQACHVSTGDHLVSMDQTTLKLPSCHHLLLSSIQVPSFKKQENQAMCRVQKHLKQN